jgi:hypothetical protein
LTALCLLALASVLCQSREARAQETEAITPIEESRPAPTPTPMSGLTVSTAKTGVPRGIINQQTSADANAAMFHFRKSRAGAATLNGDNIGNVYAEGFDGASFISGARMRFSIDGAVSAGSVPTAIEFHTGTGGGGGVERMRITSAGNVGFGTSSPAARLDVMGAANIWSGSRLAVPSGYMAAGSLTAGNIVANFGGGTGWNANTAGLMLETLDNTEISVHDSQTRLASFMYYEGGAANRMTIGRDMGWGAVGTVSINGNVGVGTNAPGVKLAVNGAGRNVYSTDAWIENNMHIQGNEAISQGGGRGRMRLGTAWGYVGMYAESSSAGAANDLVLGAGSGTVRVGPGGPSVQNFIVPNGRIGVGTSAPAVALDVNGDIRVSGNINAKYQDVAEWVPSKQKLSAGTVVVLDTGHSNHVLASNRSYDTRVAGVISAQPGLSLGEAGEGKVLVATTGRVKVKVDATRAPIQIGDLIVTSEVSGVAMRSQPVSVGGFEMHRPGTLIGKALESLEKGTGEILVLLSLQ